MRNKPSWFKPRKYVHFDHPIKAQSAKNIATSPLKVQSHSFYPFISYDNITYKTYRDKKTNKLKYKPKPRTISYASHTDSAIYSYYSKILSDSYEISIAQNNLENTVIAFRSIDKKSNIDFAKSVFDEIRNRKNCSAIGLDITGFFDNLDHEILKKSWAKILNQQKLPKDHYSVFKSITKFSTVKKDHLYSALNIPKNNPKGNGYRLCSPEEFRSEVRGKRLITRNQDTKGIPQGSPISAVLSNIYMLEFDIKLSLFIKELGGSYHRYCDDMMMIVSTEQRDLTIKFATSEIKKLKLDINTNKTEISNFKQTATHQKSDKPLQYLGFTFDGKKILLRTASLDRYSAKMKGGVKLARSTRDKRNGIRAQHGLKETELYRKKIYKLYSHLGDRNFLTYGFRAAEKMESEYIKKQLKPLWGRLIKEIEK